MVAVSEKQREARAAEVELLLLPGGRILVHNLTPAMACLLAELDPAAMQGRAPAQEKNRKRAKNK